MIALKWECPAIVKMLLHAGADVNTKDKVKIIDKMIRTICTRIQDYAFLEHIHAQSSMR